MRKACLSLELSNVSAYQGTTEAAVTLLLVIKMLAKVKTGALKKKEQVRDVANQSNTHHIPVL